MTEHRVTFEPGGQQVEVPTGSLLTEAIYRAGLEIQQPCGGQGRCGRCAVVVDGEGARRRSTLRLSAADLEAGFALACQTVVEGDLGVTIPEQERVVRRLVTDRTARGIELPFDYSAQEVQPIRVGQLELPPPTIDDNLDDLARLQRQLAAEGLTRLQIGADELRRLNSTLRASDWRPQLLFELDAWDRPQGPPRLIELSAEELRPLGLALDIGTTTVTAYLVDLESGKVLSSAAEYNGQVACGEDVISRIVFASKEGGLNELGEKVRATIGQLMQRIERRTGVAPAQIAKATVVGNTTMIHLLLAIPPESIRRTPYIPTVNQPPSLMSGEIDLGLHPAATVDCLPGVASYVGADITAGVLASGVTTQPGLSLFLDIGTNGEMVLGTGEWMVTCACSAGPAFEGAGVVDGMRATAGAIEEVWVHSDSYEPTVRVIGGVAAKGICGSGLISLLSELFVTGAIDKAGNFNLDADSDRIRMGEHGAEYVVAWAPETDKGRDIALTKVDVDNLMRAKAAIYAGFSVLAQSVGVDLADVDQVLVGGAFGQYINVEKAIQIGLLPDLPWDRFQFLGNTAVQGAYMALLSREARHQAQAIAESMTYLELSADNTFYDAFTASLFLPHTEINRFPSVAEIWERSNGRSVAHGEKT